MQKRELKFNVYSAILKIALELECPVYEVKNKLIEETGISASTLSRIENVLSTERFHMRKEAARELEIFFQRHLIQCWKLRTVSAKQLEMELG